MIVRAIQTKNKIKENEYYLVEKIIDDDIYILGHIIKYDKSIFIDENSNDLSMINKYTNPLCLNKKNIETGRKIMCINTYGKNIITKGEFYTIYDILYKEKGIELKLTEINYNLPYYYYNLTFNLNHFIIGNERLMKYYKIFYNISF
jgi:hypothetical protein